MENLIKIVTYVPYNKAMPIESFVQELAVAASQFSTDSQKVVLISNKSGIRMLIPEGEVSVTTQAEFDKLIKAENEAIENRCTGDCGMNYCDENGCIERKRNYVDSDGLIPPRPFTDPDTPVCG